MKKKFLGKVIVGTLALSLFGSGVYAGTVIKTYKTVRGDFATVEKEEVHKNRIAINVDGTKMKTKSWYANGVTYVPMREAAEALGAEVIYDSKTQTAKISKNGGQPSVPDQDIKVLNKVIVDDSNVKATLVSIEKIVDKTWKTEKYNVKFAVENKTNHSIIFQARDISADGKMINDSMTLMSTNVTSGKKADATLTIQNYDGDLPTISHNFEMKLLAYDWDTDFEEYYPVKVDF